jgi:hypothetical protein
LGFDEVEEGVEATAKMEEAEGEHIQLVFDWVLSVEG